MSEILPVNRSKHAARRYYNRISGIYDWLTTSEKKFIKKGVSLLSASNDEKILEIGCGTGTGLYLISQDLSGNGMVVGVDLARQMLMKARKNTDCANPVPVLVQGDGAALPFSKDQLDGVLCTFTLELFSTDEIQSVLMELRRILKPEGRLAVVTLAQKPRNLPVRVYELIHQLFPVVVDCRPIPLVDLLTENGFTIICDEKSINWGLPIHLTLSTNTL